MATPRSSDRFALCVENRDSGDLEKRKIYIVLPDDVELPAEA